MAILNSLLTFKLEAVEVCIAALYEEREEVVLGLITRIQTK